MTRLERYREKLTLLEAKRSQYLRNGRFAESMALNEDIEEAEKALRQAEEYEEACKPKPIREILTKAEIDEMGIIPMMIECHLVADFLVETAWKIVETCKQHGLSNVSFMPDLDDIIKRNEKFASFLATLSPELCNLITNNETFNASLHKKYIKYIEQRLK